MVILIVLLVFSVSLNIALIFGMVRKNADNDMNTIRIRESFHVEDEDNLYVEESKLS